MSISLKNVSQLASGLCSIVNSFLDNDALSTHENETSTSVRLSGESIGVNKVNFSVDIDNSVGSNPTKKLETK